MIQYFFCKSWAPEAVSSATIYWHSSPVTIKLLQFTKAEERCPSTSCKHLPEAGHFFIRQTSRYCLLWLFHWIVPLNLHESSVKWGTHCKAKCDSPSEQVPAPEACCSPTTPLRSHSISVALPDPCTTHSWGCLRVYLASCIAFWALSPGRRYFNEELNWIYQWHVNGTRQNLLLKAQITTQIQHFMIK